LVFKISPLGIFEAGDFETGEQIWLVGKQERKFGWLGSRERQFGCEF
jgi:hypothetical protein